ncbi:MAG: SpoIIE family protein phosphatase, partial [Treponema sp.]|nr:SpoIIE family protein phosphatase [Treponema sp.]
MTSPGFIVLSAALAAGLVAASAAAFLQYRKNLRMRRTEEALARILGGLSEEGFQPDIHAGVRELRDLAGSAGPGPEAKAANAAAALAARLSEAMPVYSEYRSGRTLPPCFVPRTLGPDGVFRGIGRAEGPGCEAAGYAAWPFRSEWMEFRPVNPRYAWFAHFSADGQGMESALICRTMATVLQNEFVSRGTSLHRPETLPEILYRVNEHIEGRGFAGKFVDTCLGLWDRQEKEAVLCGAGTSRLSRWSAASRTVEWVELPKSPPIGSFPNFMIEMRSPFKSTRLKLDPGDVLFLWTGIEDSSRYARDETSRIKFKNTTLPDGTVHEQQVSEWFGSDQRIVSLL